MATVLQKVSWVERDLLLVVLLVACLILGIGAISSSLETRAAALVAGGARKVDLATIRRQMLEGSLSPQKALFYKRAPR
jgi:hypothetical protein